MILALSVICASPALAQQKIHVGNLSWNADANSLRVIFGPYGNILDARIMTDRETGRSRGFGFVTMSNSEDALAAIAALNGTVHDGRTLKVNSAAPQERPPIGTPSTRRGDGHRERAPR